MTLSIFTSVCAPLQTQTNKSFIVLICSLTVLMLGFSMPAYSDTYSDNKAELKNAEARSAEVSSAEVISAEVSSVALETETTEKTHTKPKAKEKMGFIEATQELVHFPNLFAAFRTMLFHDVPLALDTVAVLDLPGDEKAMSLWADSYSIDGKCYCHSIIGFSGEIADERVATPLGELSIREVCRAVGEGPGSLGRPLYNDIQCGNGPGSDRLDETNCPGRLDHGIEGCGHIGPKWDFTEALERRAANR